jgi:hypothetical protein
MTKLTIYPQALVDSARERISCKKAPLRKVDKSLKNSKN